MPLLYSRTQVLTALLDGTTLAADEAHVPSEAARFEWAVYAAMTLLDQPSARWAEVKNAYYRPGASYIEPAADDDTPQFTREQVSQAVNNGIDLAAEHERRTYADDLDNLVVNAALTLLDHPEADFHDVVAQNYGEIPRVVRSWL